MFIIDAHQNIAFNAQQLGRDYTRWAWTTRQRESGQKLPPATTSLPDNLLAGVGILFSSIAVVSESSRARAPWQNITYRTSDDAFYLGMWQADHYRRLADDNQQIRLILSREDLDAVVQSWSDDRPLSDRIQGIVMTIDGAEPIAEPKQFEEWLELGVRIVAPARQTTRYCSDADADGEFTLLGYELLEALASYNTLLDLSHMFQRALQRALEQYAGPIFASHANPRHFHDSPRCLSDNSIIALAERDGVMGIMVYNRYLRRDWHVSDPKRRVNLSHWVDAVDYVCQVTGSVAHVGLGSDIDAGHAYGSLPYELDSSSDLWRLQSSLQSRGFSETDINAILGGNMLRKLRQTLPDG